MHENPGDPDCLLRSKDQLTRMREQMPLSETETAIVDRAVAALEILLAQVQTDDSYGHAFAHHKQTPHTKGFTTYDSWNQ